MDEYARKTKRNITYEYILIAGINDQVEHARELAELVRGRQCAVNLIPYNLVPGINLERPETATIQAFRLTLDSLHVVNTCRYTKGDNIAAACGQLALQEGNVPEAEMTAEAVTEAVAVAATA